MACALTVRTQSSEMRAGIGTPASRAAAPLATVTVPVSSATIIPSVMTS